MKLIDDLNKFVPFNEQEEIDKKTIIDFLLKNDNAFSRSNSLAHITASGWVINKDYTKVLMVYHNIYDSWSWIGGHADGCRDLLAVSIKEAKEETHINEIEVISRDIFSVEILTVDGHIKNNKYVSSHLHLNVTYLLMANDLDEIYPLLNENKAVKWINIEDIKNEVRETWMNDRIYNKLIKKMNLLGNNN